MWLAFAEWLRDRGPAGRSTRLARGWIFLALVGAPALWELGRAAVTAHRITIFNLSVLDPGSGWAGLWYHLWRGDLMREISLAHDGPAFWRWVIGYGLWAAACVGLALYLPRGDRRADEAADRYLALRREQARRAVEPPSG